MTTRTLGLNRLLNAVQLYKASNSTFVHCSVRNVLEVLYPDYITQIRTVDTVNGLKYFIEVPHEQAKPVAPV